jgi:hypothetical protein
VFLYIEINIDEPPGRGRGEIIRGWFEGMESAFYTGCLVTGTRWGAGISQSDDDDMVHVDDREEFFARLSDDPFWVQSSLTRESDGKVPARIRTYPTVYDDPRYVSLSAVIPCSDEDSGDEEFCARVSLEVRRASENLNPVFGRVEFDSAHTKTNLDVALRRKVEKSVLGARNTLRGYAWLTIISAEGVEKLGGASNLESRAASLRVFPLSRGGVLLQAAPTVKGFDDAAMEECFRVVAPILPPGLPSVHYAFPDVRFVTRDAADASS